MASSRFSIPVHLRSTSLPTNVHPPTVLFYIAPCAHYELAMLRTSDRMRQTLMIPRSTDETAMAAFRLLGPRQARPDDNASDSGQRHDDLGPLLNAVFWTLTSLSFLILALRLYCKYLRGRYLWWDDYVLMASWIALCVSAATTTVCVALDYGKHGYDIRPENLPKMPFVAVFAGFFSVLSASWSKTSFALTLLRLSSERWMRVVLWFIMVTLNAIMGAAMLTMWIKCRPVAKIWDDSVDGWCIPASKIITLYQWSAGRSPTLIERKGEIIDRRQDTPAPSISSSPFVLGSYSQS
jgi:hypothetical protein